MKTLFNELRIGNLIYDFDEHTFYPIEEIKKNTQGNMCVIYRNGSFMSTEFIPTKLNIEIYNKIKNQLIEKGFSYGFNDGKITLYLSEEWELESEFLHQFQNLYFALTGTELTIKK